MVVKALGIRAYPEWSPEVFMAWIPGTWIGTMYRPHSGSKQSMGKLFVTDLDD